MKGFGAVLVWLTLVILDCSSGGSAAAHNGGRTSYMPNISTFRRTTGRRLMTSTAVVPKCPDVVKGVRISDHPGPNLVQISWENDTCPTWYRVECKEHLENEWTSFEMRVNDTSVALKTVPACSLFDFRVAMVTFDNVTGNWSDTVQGWAHSGGLNDTIGNLHISSDDEDDYEEEERSVSFNWTLPSCNQVYVSEYMLSATPKASKTSKLTCYTSNTDACDDTSCSINFCHPLDKCLDYTLSVSISYNDSRSYGHEASVDLPASSTYVDDEAIVNLTAKSTSLKTIEIQFDIGNCTMKSASGIRTILTDYNGTVITEDENINTACNTNSSRCNYTTTKLLTPCKQYNVTVQLWSKGLLGEDTVGPVTIEEEPPSAPQHIKIQLTNQHQVEISWLPPSKNLECVTGYYVQMKPSRPTGQKWTYKNHTTYTNITEEVLPCVEYVVRVGAVTPKGKAGVYSNATFTTSMKPGKVITDVNATVEGPLNASLDWSFIQCGELLESIRIDASDNNHCEMNITKDICSVDNSTFAATCSSPVCLTLEPCTNYTFSVSVKLQEGSEFQNKSDPSNVITTKTLAPSKPLHLRSGSYNPHTLSLNWSKPQMYPQCVNHYIVWYGPSNKSELSETATTTQMNMILKDLQGCEAYDVRVWAVTIDEKNSTKYAKINHEAVMGNETEHTVSNLHVHTGFCNATLQWDAPVCNNSDFNFYVLKASDRPDVNFTCNEASCEYQMKRLEACTMYNFSVTALYDDYPDAPAAAMTHETKETIPSDPRDLKLVSTVNSSITVSWTAPKEASKCIDHYNVSHWSAYGDGDNQIVSNSTLTVVLHGLHPCTNYSVEVVGITIGGKPGTAASSTEITQEEAPSPPAIISASGTSYNSADIQWKPPDTAYECVRGYNVTVYYEETHVVFATSTPSNITSQIVDSGLRACGQYKAKVIAFTDSYNASGPQKQFTTSKLQPPKPNAYVDNRTANELEISWSPPDLSNVSLCGKPTLQVTCDAKQQARPYSAVCRNTDTFINDDQRCWIPGLKPFTYYTCKIWARNSGGQSADPVRVRNQTLEAAPGRIQGLQVTNRTDKYVELKWKAPDPTDRNGIIRSYIIKYYGWRHGFTNDSGPVVIKSDCLEACNLTLSSLKPEYNYIINVSAVTIAEGPSYSTEASTYPGVPVVTPSNNASVIKGSDPKHQGVVQIPSNLFSNSSGDILSYSLLVAQKGYEGNITNGFFRSKPPRLNTWYNATSGTDAVLAYSATPEGWHPPQDGLFVLGCNSSCDHKSMLGKYCNGPLRPGTTYIIRIRAYTTNTFVDAQLPTFNTDPIEGGSSSVGVIVGVLMSLLIMAAICFSIFFYHRRHPIPFLEKVSQRAFWRSGQPRVGSRSHDVVADHRALELSRIQSHFRLLKENNNALLQEEYTRLGRESDAFNHTTEEANKPENKLRKNRYTNILPFDHSRVKLEPDPEEPCSDYVNASYVEGYNRSVEYIASQGPKPDTCVDFWRMVWEQQVSLIVMLTQCIEDEKIKCQQYWPEEGEKIEYGDITIKLKKTVVFADYLKRIFLIRRVTNMYGEQQRTLTHLHFVQWGDHDRPSDTKPLLAFIQDTRQHMDPHAPTIVHCSAGVGRTGTFVALDILLQQALQERQVRVFETVLGLRNCRTKMVQNSTQYAFIYECLSDAIQDPSFGQQINDQNDPIYENMQRETCVDDEEGIYENVGNGNKHPRWRE